MQQKKKSAAVFSVRASEAEIEQWRIYAQASGKTMTALTAEAMHAYIEQNPLTGYRQKMYEAMKGARHMTVREWIEKQAAKFVEGFEADHGRHFSESDKIPYINELVEECVDGWEGGEDPLADENEWWRDHTERYIEEQAEKIVEHLSAMEDEAEPEED